MIIAHPYPFSQYIFGVCSLPNELYLLQVTASAWLNDLRNQIERTRILSTVYRSASALGSRLPSMASAKAKVAGAGAILRPVSSRTQVYISYPNIAFNWTMLERIRQSLIFNQIMLCVFGLH